VRFNYLLTYVHVALNLLDTHSFLHYVSFFVVCCCCCCCSSFFSFFLFSFFCSFYKNILYSSSRYCFNVCFYKSRSLLNQKVKWMIDYVLFWKESETNVCFAAHILHRTASSTCELAFESAYFFWKKNF